MAEDTKPAQKRVVGRPFVSGDPRGNPGGRPRMSEASREMLADAETKAIKALVDALGAKKCAAFEGVIIESDIPDHPVRADAATKLLDRRLGKPAQAIVGPEGGPFQVEGLDLTKLSDAQFAALVALRDAIKSGG